MKSTMSRFALSGAALFLIFELSLDAGGSAFAGEFAGANYNIHFFNSGSALDVGENSKEISAVNNYINISSSSTYTSIFTEWMTHRHIMNQIVGPPEITCVNSYWAGVDVRPDFGEGTVTPGSNMVLNVSPADEEFELPLYFSADTNIAIMVDAEPEGPPSAEYGLGLSLLLRQGSGMDVSSLSGTYVRYSMGNAVHGTPGNGWGNIDRLISAKSIINFDGSGNYTESGFVSFADRVTDEHSVSLEPDSVVDTVCGISDFTTMPFITNGTYSVEPNGVSVMVGLLGAVTNQISPDGSVGASVLTIPQPGYAQSYLNVTVKQPTSMPTTPVDAVYFITQLSEKFHGSSETNSSSNVNSVELGRSYIYLKSDGSFSGRSDFWQLENTLENVWTNINPTGVADLISANVFSTEAMGPIITFLSGTYSIAANGVVTLFFWDREIQVQLSANGEFLVLGETMGSAGDGIIEQRMMIGVRREPPPPMSTPVVFNNDMTMTSTGLVMTATMPIGYPVEGISTDNLIGGRWCSCGIFSTETGTVEIHDPSATNATSHFYSATFVPW